MTNILVILMVIVLAALFYLWLKNSQEPKIREIVFSGVLVGGVLALIGVWNVLKEKKIDAEFSTSIMVSKELPDKLIQDFDLGASEKKYNLPRNSMFNSIGYVLQEYKKSYPEKFKIDKSSQTLSGSFYSELIGFHILETLFRTFHHAWLLEIKHYRSPHGFITLTIPPVGINQKVYKKTWKELTKDINKEIFRIPKLNSQEAFRDTLIVPPESKVELTFGESNFTLRIDNKYSSILISMNFLMGGVGIGDIESIANLSSEDSYKFSTYTYSIEVKGKIKKLYSGSEYAQNCETWINSIITLLKDEFDYQNYLNILKEWQLRILNKNSVTSEPHK